jgi:hypothetical protein
MMGLLSFTPFFEKSAYDELRSACDFKVLERSWSRIVIRCDGKLPGNGWAESSKFIHYCLPLFSEREMPEGFGKNEMLAFLLEYLSSESCSKIGSFIIEAIQFERAGENSAKDIEVYLGTKLESAGFPIDMKNPQSRLYIVVCKKAVYAGYCASAELMFSMIDINRAYASRADRVSRAERKLSEAFRIFRIETPRQGHAEIAIDIGAAPGGWSMGLSSMGYKVIAIDNADLDTGAFSNEEIEVVEMKCDGADEGIRGFASGNAGVLHLRGSFEEASESVLKSGIRSSFIGIDVNAEPEISVSALLLYLPALTDNCKSIITIKCKTKNVGSNIEAARMALGDACKIIRLKALPSNRQEITALCVKGDSITGT